MESFTIIPYSFEKSEVKNLSIIPELRLRRFTSCQGDTIYNSL